MTRIVPRQIKLNNNNESEKRYNNTQNGQQQLQFFTNFYGYAQSFA